MLFFSRRSRLQRTARVRLGVSLAAARARERHVVACLGWAGEKSGLFEHPVAYSGVFLDSVSIDPSIG